MRARRGVSGGGCSAGRSDAVVLAQLHTAYPAAAASLRLAQIATYPRGEPFIDKIRSPLMTEKSRLRARCTNRSLRPYILHMIERTMRTVRIEWVTET